MNAPESTALDSQPRRALNVIPYPGRRPDLATLNDVRREMARVYRDMKLRRIPTQDGTRLAFVLAQIGKLIQQGELERRLEALEYATGQRIKP